MLELNNEEERALELHKKLIIINASTVIKYDSEHFENVKKAGITASNHTVTRPASLLRDAIKEISDCFKWMSSYPDECLLVQTADDIRKAKREGKEGIILGPQNANFIENDLDFLQIFKALGITIIQLTYNELNLIGAGCTENKDPGLSNFGQEVVKAMNRLGIVIDISHCGVQTTMDAIDVSKDPCIVSHGSPYAVCPNPRNKTDEQLHALAEKDGVIGLTAYAPITEVKKNVHPTIDDFFTHVDYIIDLIGVNHIGIGSDHEETQTVESLIAFEKAYPDVVGIYTHDKGGRWVKGMESITCFPTITAGLLTRGYSDGEVSKIMGANFLRVFEKVLK